MSYLNTCAFKYDKVRTCDDSSVLSTTGKADRLVILQPEFTGQVVGKIAPSKREHSSCFWRRVHEEI